MSRESTIQLLNKALNAPEGKGLRLEFETPEQCNKARMRFYNCIRLERAASKNLYEVYEPQWGTTPWDNVSIVRESPTTLVLRADDYLRPMSVSVVDLNQCDKVEHG